MICNIKVIFSESETIDATAHVPVVHICYESAVRGFCKLYRARSCAKSCDLSIPIKDLGNSAHDGLCNMA